MENIGNSGVSGNRITSKYTYLGNSLEFWVVLEPWERILTGVENGVRRKWWKTGLGIGLEVKGKKEPHLRSREVEEKIGIWINENVVEPGVRSTKNRGVDRGGIWDHQ